MGDFHVKPTDMLVSSAGFTDLQSSGSQIFRGLVGSLDAAAGMAGDDKAGRKFAASYDPAAQAVVDARGSAHRAAPAFDTSHQSGGAGDQSPKRLP